jgi:hypothetical protein
MRPSNRLLENFPQGSENLLRQGRAKMPTSQKQCDTAFLLQASQATGGSIRNKPRRQDREGEDESKTPKKKSQEVAPLLYEDRDFFPPLVVEATGSPRARHIFG